MELELAPLTILVGPNGAGKSSVLEALMLMAAAIQEQSSPLKAAKIYWERLDDMRDIFYGRNGEAWLALGFEVTVDDAEAQSLASLLKADEEIIGPVESIPSSGKITTVGYMHLHRPTGEYGHVFFINGNDIFYYKEEDGARSKPRGLVAGSPIFLQASLQYAGRPLRAAAGIESLLRERIEGRIKFISACRGAVAWSEEPYRLQEELYVGVRGEQLLAVLSYLQAEEEEHWAPYALLAEEFGIKRLWAGWHPQKDVLFGRYEDAPSHTGGLRLPMLGFGSRQILTVIAQLAVSKPGDIILVEEPEMSLHPAYQAKLPVLFGLAVLEGKQVITTTHSSYFPLALPCVLREEGYVLEGETPAGYQRYHIKLEPEDVAIYEIMRGPDGTTRAKKLELDENGLKEGIPSFLEVEKELLSRYMREA